MAIKTYSILIIVIRGSIIYIYQRSELPEYLLVNRTSIVYKYH